MHISRNGGHLSFFIFPHFWHVFKACDASRGILPKKVKNDWLILKYLKIKTLNWPFNELMWWFYKVKTAIFKWKILGWGVMGGT